MFASKNSNVLYAMYLSQLKKNYNYYNFCCYYYYHPNTAGMWPLQEESPTGVKKQLQNGKSGAGRGVCCSHPSKKYCEPDLQRIPC